MCGDEVGGPGRSEGQSCADRSDLVGQQNPVQVLTVSGRRTRHGADRGRQPQHERQDAGGVPGVWQEAGPAAGRVAAAFVADAYATVDRGTRWTTSTTPFRVRCPRPPAPVDTPKGTRCRCSHSSATTAEGAAGYGETGGDYMEVKIAQGSLVERRSGGIPYRPPRVRGRRTGTTLATARGRIRAQSSVNWEGEAADAAYRSFNDYRAFLVEAVRGVGTPVVLGGGASGGCTFQRG